MFVVIVRNGDRSDLQENLETKQSWTIENKYYQANITFHLVNYDQSENFQEEFEGIIMLPHPDQVTSTPL